jgi:hypothetical protein
MRVFVLLILTHERRRVVHFNVTEHPSAEWTTQQIINAFPWDEACHSRLFVSIEMLDFCISHLHSGVRPFCSFPSLIPCMRGFFHAIRLLRPDRL